MEEIALIEFINDRPVGNVLRDIAERRLCDLKRQEIRVYPTAKIYTGRLQVRCYNKITGETYPNMRVASEENGVNYDCLKSDMNKGIYKYNIVPV